MRVDSSHSCPNLAISFSRRSRLRHLSYRTAKRPRAGSSKRWHHPRSCPPARDACVSGDPSDYLVGRTLCRSCYSTLPCTSNNVREFCVRFSRDARDRWALRTLPFCCNQRSGNSASWNVSVDVSLGARPCWAHACYEETCSSWRFRCAPATAVVVPVGIVVAN